MAAIAGAAISGGSSLLSGITGGKAAAKAAKAQAQAQQAAINEQHNEFSTIQQNNLPWLTEGQQGLQGYGDLVGTNGNLAQQQAIQGLQQSPLYQSQYGTGVDTVLQNAAATGGLRGGNTQTGLAQFGSGLLAQTIQQQLANLGGLSNMGQSAASGTNAAATNTGSAISSLLSQGGQQQAAGINAQGIAGTNTITGLTAALQKYLQNGPGLSGANPSGLTSFGAYTPSGVGIGGNPINIQAGEPAYGSTF